MIDKILRNLIRLGLVGIYPMILILCFILIWCKEKYRNIIKENYKKIAVITIIFMVLLLVGMAIYFSVEDTIYVYDYAGHWKRALIVRDLFLKDPLNVLPRVYDSMLYDDYSLLPGLFQIIPLIFGTSYSYFSITSVVLFLTPSIALFQILYLSYFEGKLFSLSLAIISFFPIYINSFYGKIDVVGLFFVFMCVGLIILPEFEEIDFVDNLSMNLFGFLMIFLRRWYLYSLVGLYIAYFIKYLVYIKFTLNKENFKKFIKILFSGILLLVVILAYFYPFFSMVINNNYSEAYEIYDRSGKFIELINFYSVVIFSIFVYGLYKSYREKKNIEIIYLFSTISIISIFLFWGVQSMEYHHYNMINGFLLFFYAYGIENLINQNLYAKLAVSIVLLFQVVNVFLYNGLNVPFFTNVKKIPEIRGDKQDIVDFSNYLKEITTNKGEFAYLASSTYYFNDDLLRNAILPDLRSPEIITAVFDLRDGFPKNLQYVKYIITIDPILYTDKDYQHIYDIITNALLSEGKVKELYRISKELNISGLNITIYEKIGEWSQEVKEYFYEEMLRYYPDKEDFFAYILD